MARRRAVERAVRRRDVTDRLLVAVIVVVAASGLMSTLPAAAQVSVGRIACRVGSLGLGSCGADPIALLDPQLAPPRCSALAALDQTLPEVRVSETVTAEGLRIQTRTPRSGESVLHLGADPTDDPPLLMAGESRGSDEVLPGVEVDRWADWYLPGGQGGDVVVAAAQEWHRQWLQQRSSLAALGAVFGSSGREMPEPTLLHSRVWTGVSQLPTSTVAARTGTTQNRVVVRPNVAGHLMTNRITGNSVLTIAVSGTWAGRPVTGAASWRRNGSGAVQAVTVAVVSDRALVRGEPALPSDSAEVAYITIPISSDVERRLVERWLSSASGFVLPLTGLLGLSQPKPTDQLATYLTRAATVTVVRYGTNRLWLSDQVTQQLIASQRVDWPDVTLTEAFTVAPQPNGAVRTLVADPECRS